MRTHTAFIDTVHAYNYCAHRQRKIKREHCTLPCLKVCSFGWHGSKKQKLLVRNYLPDYLHEGVDKPTEAKRFVTVRATVIGSTDDWVLKAFWLFQQLSCCTSCSFEFAKCR